MIPSNFDIILYGGPGAGKGTQAKALVQNLGAAHLEMGEEVRKLAEGSTSQAHEIREIMEKGELVPLPVTNAIASQFVEQVPLDQRIIFDGYPRNLEQAQSLDELLQKNGRTAKMIYITLPDEVAVRRLTRRATIEHRPDDLDEAAVQNRLQVFHQEAQDLLKHYREQNRLMEVNGDQSIEEVTRDIAGLI